MTPTAATPSPRSPSPRALSFGARAAAYAAFRPGYPEAAVAAVIEAARATETPGAHVPTGPAAEPWRALDLAAGTGKLTRLLVGRGAPVIAVEPDEHRWLPKDAGTMGARAG